MVRHSNKSRVAVSLAVVLALVAVGAGAPGQPDLASTIAVELSPGAANLHDLASLAAIQADTVLTHLRPVASHATAFVAHAPELLLVFELGLLVEHLRLLDRVGDSLHAVDGPASEEASDDGG